MTAEKSKWKSPTYSNLFQVKWGVNTFPKVIHREHLSFWNFLELRFYNYGGFGFKNWKFSSEMVFLDGVGRLVVVF